MLAEKPENPAHQARREKQVQPAQAAIIEGAAKGYADTFFTRLKAEIEVPETQAPTVEAVATPAPSVAPATSPATGLPPLVWGGGLVLAVVVFLLWQWG